MYTVLYYNKYGNGMLYMYILISFFTGTLLHSVPSKAHKISISTDKAIKIITIKITFSHNTVQ